MFFLLRCLGYFYLQVSSSGRLAVVDTLYSNGLYMHANEVMCPLYLNEQQATSGLQSSNDVVALKYQIAVSNDGKHYSSEASLLAADETCNHCDTETNVCYVKVN